MSPNVPFFRFSLPALFGGVFFAAFAVAAIRFASPLWAGITMAVTVPILLGAVLAAMFRRGEARIFWAGMAICGWGYWLVVLPAGFENGVGQYLPTTCLLNLLHERLQRQVPIASTPMMGGMGNPRASSGIKIEFLPTPGGAMSGRPQMGMGMSSGGGPGGGGMVVTTAVGPDLILLLRTGQALFALFFGLVGGIGAKWFCRPRSEAKK